MPERSRKGARRGKTSSQATASDLPSFTVPGWNAVDWQQVSQQLEEDGSALVPAFFDPRACQAIFDLYERDDLFRNRVVMERHAFGQGEYKYFSHPLPLGLGELRARLYGQLVSIANRWNEQLGIERVFPPSHEEYLQECHDCGQTRATPLLLNYRQGDYNRLHQDIYGEEVFPLQVTVLLSEPQRDFTGGEFVTTEQRPRAQSRVLVHPLERGDALIFAVKQRPMPGRRGYYRVQMRHGVSRVRSGHRRTLGVIFHDAA